MNPENANQVVDKQNPVFKVTPLSKYLAMILFIVMPFIGGWIGYQYAPEKVVEVERVVVETNDNHRSEDEKNSEKVHSDSDLSKDRENSKAGYSNFDYIRHNYYMKETGVSYDISTNTIRIRDWDAPMYDEDNYEDVDSQLFNNLIVASDSIDVTILPYLTILSSTTDKLFLTRHCFKASECSYYDLYEFDLINRSLHKMKIAEFYAYMISSELSPLNKRFFIRSGESATEEGSSVYNHLLYALDLYTDTVVTLDSEKSDTGFQFCFPSMFCELKVNWLSENDIEVSMYNRDGREAVRAYKLSL